MKKLLIAAVTFAMIVFFAIPSFAFAEPGDNSTALGDPAGAPAGQYEMDPNMGSNPDNSYADVPEESNGDNIEVYCINETVTLTGNTDAYEETGTNVSDELIANGTPEDNAVAVGDNGHYCNRSNRHTKSKCRMGTVKGQ